MCYVSVGSACLLIELSNVHQLSVLQTVGLYLMFFMCTNNTCVTWLCVFKCVYVDSD